jgi:hypothetical protein
MPSAFAQVEKDSTFSVGGLLFGDLYHVASFHTDEGEGATGWCCDVAISPSMPISARSYLADFGSR